MSQAHASHTPADDHDHGHAHHGPVWLAHHFDTPKQQFDSGKLAMWVFLATEVLMFAGLFCAYAVWRARHFDSFRIGHQYLDTMWGAFNTVVLIASSFTMAWAVRTAQLGRRSATLWLLGLTFLGGIGFMCVKYVEYSHKFHLGIGPGIWYKPVYAEPSVSDPAAAIALNPAAPIDASALPKPGAAPAGLTLAAAPHADAAHEQHGHGVHHSRQEMAVARPFFSIYFAMTGLHGLHVVVGMGLIAWVFMRAYRGDFSAEFNAPVDIVGLYWHLVDLIWIFLFPLLYLIGH
jgi:cytochrome c oxidase subunit 3